jgi:hypothetical protein
METLVHYWNMDLYKDAIHSFFASNNLALGILGASLIILFTICNRVRGDHSPWSWIKIEWIAELFIPLTIGVLFFGISFKLLVVVLLYELGEAPGWGKWVGTMLHGTPPRNPDEKEASLLLIEPTVQYVFRLDPIKNFYAFCFVSLILRGFWWWVGLVGFISFYYFSFYSICSLVLLSVMFPLSFCMARNIDETYGHFIQEPWDWAELFYGSIQGSAFFILFLAALNI